jgi:hypothetical protein
MPKIEFRFLETTRIERKNLVVYLSSAVVGSSLGVLATGAAMSNIPVTVLLLGFVFSSLILMVWATIDPPHYDDSISILVAFDWRRGQLLNAANRDGFVRSSCSKFANGSNQSQEHSTSIKQGQPENEMQVVDVAWYDLLDFLGVTYREGWAPTQRLESESAGIAEYSYKHAKKTQHESNENHELDKNRRKPLKETSSTVINYQYLEKELNEYNSFAKRCGAKLLKSKDDWRIELPPATEVRYVRSDNRESLTTLLLRNRFCSLELCFVPRPVRNGLGPLARFAVKNGTKDDPPTQNLMELHYGHMTLDLQFKAVFNRFFVLLPNSNDYLKWVEDFHDRIEDYFSSTKEQKAFESTYPPFRIPIEGEPATSTNSQ